MSSHFRNHISNKQGSMLYFSIVDFDDLLLYDILLTYASFFYPRGPLRHIFDHEGLSICFLAEQK